MTSLQGALLFIPHNLFAGALLAGQLRGEEAALRGAGLPPRQRHHERRQRLLHRHWHCHWTLGYRKVCLFLMNYFVDTSTVITVKYLVFLARSLELSSDPYY